MVDPVVLVVALVVGIHVLAFALVPVLDPGKRRAFRHRLGVDVRPVAAGWTVALLACLALGAVLEPPFDSDWSRGTVRVTYLYGFALVGGVTLGATGMTTAVMLVRRVRRIRSASGTPPGRVVLSGTARPRPDGGTAGDAADDRAEPTTPLFDRPALCWSWSAAIERVNNPVTRVLDTNTETVASGSGGTPFQVETGAAPVFVDPEEVAVEVDHDASRSRPYGAPPPGRLTESALGGFGTPIDNPDATDSENVYREGRIQAGEPVTVVGRVDENGHLAADGRVVAGDRETVVRRLSRRALWFGGGGAALLAVALPLYLAWLGA